ncbi:hypothetical protein B0H14DRAFT_2636435 [Mycena olivaceomarginata]|nr:hypothetical protein B0H14DRAFT_2636435 [Mycena olivaceomarginata]
MSTAAVSNPLAHWYLLCLGCAQGDQRRRGEVLLLQQNQDGQFSGHGPPRPLAQPIFCEGYLHTFSGVDTYKRHMDSKLPTHVTPAWRAFLAAFEQLPDIVRKWEECDHGDKRRACIHVTAVRGTRRRGLELHEWISRVPWLNQWVALLRAAATWQQRTLESRLLLHIGVLGPRHRYLLIAATAPY